MFRIGGSRRSGRGCDRRWLIPWIPALAILLAEPALTQAPPSDRDQDGDVLIGTFEIGSPPATATAPGRDGASESPGDVADDDIDAVLGAGRRALAEGRHVEAQRQFERVIALDRTSRQAAEARRHLADLYRMSDQLADTAPAAQPSAATAPRPPADATRSSGSAPARAKDMKPAGRPVRPDIEERFVAEAGDRVFFGPGSAELGGRARAVVDQQASWLADKPELDATIEGYADDQPLSAEQQDELSEQRAEAVRQRLIAAGIDAGRLAIVPWGRERRVAECLEAACTAQNRRAVTVLTVRAPGKPLGQLGDGTSKMPHTARYAPASEP